jgi:hypothetical protein
VNAINQGRIKFKLSSVFPYTSVDQPYNVSFLVNRSNFDLQHTAIDSAWKSLGDEVLFPEKIEVEEPQVNMKKLASGILFNLSDRWML